jgi:glycosyltransferase involved in cell wall biosynthesis
MVLRGIAQLMLPGLFIRALQRHISERVDAVIVYSPPLPLARVGAHYKRHHEARYVLNVQDIFPQNAIDLGVLKGALPIWFFERMERTAYAAADVVTVHSEGNREQVLASGRIGAGKLVTLHNWIDTTQFAKSNRSGPFRREFGLQDKFVVLFAGVIGPSQGLDIVLEVARRIKEDGHERICFLFVGDGSHKTRLQTKARQNGLDNVMFKGFVAKEDYPSLVGDCDLGLVCLSPLNHTAVVPGKILGYMAGGLPVMALLNRESGGHEIIREAQCGVSISSDTSPVNSALILTQLYNDRTRLKEFGQNGRAYVNEHYTKEICVDGLQRHLTKEK